MCTLGNTCVLINTKEDPTIEGLLAKLNIPRLYQGYAAHENEPTPKMVRFTS